MTVQEIKDQICFMLGIPANKLVEDLQPEKAIAIAFRELKRYIKTPVDKTVPYTTRIKLQDVGIYTKRVLNVQAARPRIGLTMSSIDAGNVFQLAAYVNTLGGLGNSSPLNINPILTEMGMAQVRNTLTTDFQWTYDVQNDVVYIPHRDPRPAQVTIRYVPDYKDVSEIQSFTYQDYLVRMSLANMKIALGRARSKYTIEGSNVTLDGEILLDEGNTELEKIREELGSKKNKIVILN